jgi:hypothetical protein
LLRVPDHDLTMRRVVTAGMSLPIDDVNVTPFCALELIALPKDRRAVCCVPSQPDERSA